MRTNFGNKLSGLGAGAFSVSVDHSGIQTPTSLPSVQAVRQEVFFNPLRFHFRCSRSINPCVISTMDSMLVEKPFLSIISDPDVPYTGMAAF